MRYIVENLDITQLNEVMGKHIEIHNKKYGLYQFRSALKVNDSQNLT